jgi:hypothetical protein
LATVGLVIESTADAAAPQPLVVAKVDRVWLVRLLLRNEELPRRPFARVIGTSAPLSVPSAVATVSV